MTSLPTWRGLWTFDWVTEMIDKYGELPYNALISETVLRNKQHQVCDLGQ